HDVPVAAAVFAEPVDDHQHPARRPPRPVPAAQGRTAVGGDHHVLGAGPIVLMLLPVRLHPSPPAPAPDPTPRPLTPLPAPRPVAIRSHYNAFRREADRAGDRAELVEGQCSAE